jgi:ABC-type Fe3+ transport system permease subunit
MLCLIFVPIYGFYWWYNRGEYLKANLEKNNDVSATSGVLYLLLSIFGWNIINLAIMQNDFNSSTYEKKSSSMSASRFTTNLIIYAILIIMTIVWLFPFFGIVLESFKSETKM